MAGIYKLNDLLTKPEGYQSHSRYEVLRFIPKDAVKILDVGCGTGEFGERLKDELEREVWGIEIDRTAALVAQRKLDKVLVGDVFDLIDSIPDRYFDCLVFNDILEHLVNPFQLLMSMKSKLTGNGVVVCSIPNVRYIYTLFDLLVKKQWKYVDAGILDKTHVRFFTRKSIRETLHSLGYEILRMEGINGIKIWKFAFLNLLSLGYLADTRFNQFACIAKPVASPATGAQVPFFL